MLKCSFTYISILCDVIIGTELIHLAKQRKLNKEKTQFPYPLIPFPSQQQIYVYDGDCPHDVSAYFQAENKYQLCHSACNLTIEFHIAIIASLLACLILCIGAFLSLQFCFGQDFTSHSLVLLQGLKSRNIIIPCH